MLRRWRHKDRFIGPVAAQPYLVAAKLTRPAIDTAPGSHQGTVHLHHQAMADGEVFTDALHAQRQGVHVAENFLHVVHGHARHAFHLVKHQVAER